MSFELQIKELMASIQETDAALAEMKKTANKIQKKYAKKK